MASVDIRVRDDPSENVWDDVPIPTGRRWPRWYALCVGMLDLIAMMVGAMVGSLGRFGMLSSHVGSGTGPSYVLVGSTGAVVWVLTLAASGAYNTATTGQGPEEYRRVVDATVRYLALVTAIAFFMKLEVARGFIVITVPIAFLLTVCFRHGMRGWLYRQRLNGRFVRTVLAVGSGYTIGPMVRHFDRKELAEFRIIGACIPEGDRWLGKTKHEVPVLGVPLQAWELAQQLGVEVIAVSDAQALPGGGIKHLARQVEGSRTTLMAIPSLTDVAGPRITMNLAAGLPLLHVGMPELRGAKRWVKEIFERAAAMISLLILSPFMIFIGLLIRCTSQGPAIFRQQRVGIGGRRFMICKFRTMVADADAQRDDLLHLNEIDAVLFKIKDDPRITTMGRFLRRWSIDELPQLWNVVRGDMSLVGPRPPLPSEVILYEAEAHRRLLVKPGITGLWQVSGRSGLSWEETVQLDLYYIENWSPMMDMVLLVKTIRAVLHRHGAC